MNTIPVKTSFNLIILEIKFWAISGSEQITVKDYSDWKLNPKYFEILSKMFGKHDLDAFATASNSQVAIYYSRDINALKQDWKHQRL